MEVINKPEARLNLRRIADYPQFDKLIPKKMYFIPESFYQHSPFDFVLTILRLAITEKTTEMQLDFVNEKGYVSYLTADGKICLVENIRPRYFSSLCRIICELGAGKNPKWKKINLSGVIKTCIWRNYDFHFTSQPGRKYPSIRLFLNKR